MACPILKTLQISFTAPNPVPDNGYRVKWRVVGTTTYTTATGPFTNSPVVLNNIPACENVEGTVEAVCGATYSSVATFLATKDTVYVCNASLTGSTTSGSYYTYPKRLFDLQGSGDTVTINYDAVALPNRFNIYNSDNTLVANSGWKGIASYAGPWGNTLSTATAGSFNFSKSATGGDGRWYYLTTEFVGTTGNTSDTWTATLACTSAPTTAWTITPSTTTVVEGNTVTFNVVSANLPSPSTVWYTISGMQQADFTDYQTAGSFVITNNTGSFTKTLVNDGVTEGNQSFTASVRLNSAIGEIKATSVPVTVTDPGAATPAYTVTPSVTSVNEGSSVIFNVTAANVANGTTLYYTVSGGIAAADFTDNTLSGSFVVNNQAGAFTKTLKNDLTTEGAETFDVQVRTTGIGGNTVAYCGPITVNDTSITGGAVTPTYTLLALNQSSEAVTTINEGTNLTIRLNTTDVANGTTIPYTVTGISSGDLGGSSDALTGNFTISGNTATKNFYIAADTTTEGTETFVLSLTGLSKSISVTINDSSPASSWTGYDLLAVASDCSLINGNTNFTAYKLNSPGSILPNDVLYTAQNISSPLATGYYTDGTYKYTVNTGTVSSKVDCPPAAGSPAYYLVARVGSNIVTSINEGQTVVFSLVTENVANGTVVPWVVSGINAADLSAGSLSGNFTVGTTTTASFTLANDFTTEGTESMTLTLPNNNVNSTITITDSSQTPTMYYQLSGCGTTTIAYTTLAPTLGTGQQYVLPGSTTLFYTYTGASSTFSFPPTEYNGSIQRANVLGCP
jgi:hypothetical protein